MALLKVFMRLLGSTVVAHAAIHQAIKDDSFVLIGTIAKATILPAIRS
ncbi:MAG: hypothetical protein V5789_09595 [Colwellia sp.]